jgi:hypothetical protein
LPSKWAILPSPMHTIDAIKHPRKSSRCILCKDSGSVFFIWLSDRLDQTLPQLLDKT